MNSEESTLSVTANPNPATGTSSSTSQTRPPLRKIESALSIYQGEFITFEEISPAPKTQRWAVLSTQGRDVLGHVKWFGRWRKYCFFPAEGCVFEEKCMRDIALFIEDRTAEFRRDVTAIVAALKDE